MRTWQLEMATVALVLFAAVVAGGGGWPEVLGAGAVLLSFGHAQVADRLAEVERDRLRIRGVPETRHEVTCVRWLARYLAGKEILWVAYFVIHRSWSALAGCAVFLAYPAWRRLWRRL